MEEMIGISDNADIGKSQTIQIFRPERQQDIMWYGMFSNREDENTLHEIGIVERVKQALTAINVPDGVVATTEGKEEEEEVSTYRTFYL